MSQESLHKKIARIHQERFGEAPRVMAYAPGRLEILGNHTDYNEGVALAAAMDAGICIAFSMLKQEAESCVLFLEGSKEEARFSSGDLRADAAQAWANPIKGILKQLFDRAHFNKCPAFQMTIGGNLPAGAGLSCSAAVDVAVSLILRRFLSLDISRVELARLCRDAEAEFAGVRCGLLDPMASLFGVNHALILLDFKTLSIQPVAISPRVVFAVCAPPEGRQLSETGYNERRNECEAAVAVFAKALGRPVASLREVAAEEFAAHRKGLDPVQARRVQHVLDETRRATEAADLIRGGDYKAVGRLMLESHESSVKLFENSSPAQDFMVEQARRIPGFLGARLCGGGFGGAIVLLAEAECYEKASFALAEACRVQFGADCFLQAVRPSSSARLFAGASPEAE